MCVAQSLNTVIAVSGEVKHEGGIGTVEEKEESRYWLTLETHVRSGRFFLGLA